MKKILIVAVIFLLAGCQNGQIDLRQIDLAKVNFDWPKSNYQTKQFVNKTSYTAHLVRGDLKKMADRSPGKAVQVEDKGILYLAIRSKYLPEYYTLTVFGLDRYKSNALTIKVPDDEELTSKLARESVVAKNRLEKAGEAWMNRISRK